MTIGELGEVPFRAGAEAYDGFIGRYSPELSGRFLEDAGISPDMRVLDVGCGTGALTSALAALVGTERVVALDPAEEFVAVCRERAEGVEVVLGYAESLPFPDKSFDAVLAQLAVNFIEDPVGGAQEMRRVARPGAVVAASAWAVRHGGMTLIRDFWQSAIELGLPRAEELDQRTMRFGELADLTQLWSSAGLDEIKGGSVHVGADYADFDDLWSPIQRGASPAGVYAASLKPAQREELRGGLWRRLGGPAGPFRLWAEAVWVCGRA